MAWLMIVACIRIYTLQVIESIRKPHTNSENYIEYVYIDYWSIKGTFHNLYVSLTNRALPL
jgi:hypothetical protein